MRLELFIKLLSWLAGGGDCGRPSPPSRPCTKANTGLFLPCFVALLSVHTWSICFFCIFFIWTITLSLIGNFQIPLPNYIAVNSKLSFSFAPSFSEETPFSHWTELEMVWGNTTADLLLINVEPEALANASSEQDICASTLTLQPKVQELCRWTQVGANCPQLLHHSHTGFDLPSIWSYSWVTSHLKKILIQVSGE